MRLTILPAILLGISAASPAAAQQTNGPSAALDVNGSSLSGSPPYGVSIELPGPVVCTVSGAANRPFVLLNASGLDVGNTIFDASTQIDVGPSPTALIDGVAGPFEPFFANTGSGGSAVFQAAVDPMTPTGSVFNAVQAVVVDFSLPPFNVAASAATALTYTPDIGTNSAPVADPGPNFFANTNVCVTLDGTASFDPEASGLTYSWTQTSGTSVMLDDATAAQPTFIAPAAATTLIFELTVNDGSLSSAPAQLIVPIQLVAATVSFSTDVVPIFSANGCVGCHGSSSPGGGMNLTGSDGAIYGQLSTTVTDTGTVSGPRANPCDPENSAILLKPLSTGAGGVSHGGGNIFADTMNADYLTLLTWLQEGAQFN